MKDNNYDCSYFFIASSYLFLTFSLHQVNKSSLLYKRSVLGVYRENIVSCWINSPSLIFLWQVYYEDWIDRHL